MLTKISAIVKNISQEVFSGPIYFDPQEKEILDRYVNELHENLTNHKLEQDNLWTKKIKDQSEQPWC
jgi:hypothetical protein